MGSDRHVDMHLISILPKSKRTMKFQLHSARTN